MRWTYLELFLWRFCILLLVCSCNILPFFFLKELSERKLLMKLPWKRARKDFTHFCLLFFITCFLWCSEFIASLLMFSYFIFGWSNLFVMFQMWHFSWKLQLLVQPLGMTCPPSETHLRCLLKCIKKMLIMFLTMSNAILFLYLFGKSCGTCPIILKGFNTFFFNLLLHPSG